MSSTLMMERCAPSGAMPMSGGMNAPATAPTAGWMMMPRCEMRIERCKDGMKLFCKCDDQVACATLQNLCAMLAGGTCSCCCMWNGVNVCTCTFQMGFCKCEPTADGVCFTCTSGDAQCCAMIQSCCDCLKCMLECGCTCCLMINGTPVCCATC